jgi:hypothetical protein
VKAFNTTFAPTLLAGEVDGQQLDVLMAGDDGAAKQKVSQLIPRGKGDTGEMSTEHAEPGFERDIRPLFRQQDIGAMSFAFDLASYEDVRTHAEAIYERVAGGSMPCDARWPPEQVERLRAWADAGSHP